MHPRSLFSLAEHLERLSKDGDPLEVLAATVEFEPEHMARANAAKSAIRDRVEHVFAHQKNRYGLFIRTIGIARAQAKLTLANLAYNFNRLIFHERCAATG